MHVCVYIYKTKHTSVFFYSRKYVYSILQCMQATCVYIKQKQIVTEQKTRLKKN